MAIIVPVPSGGTIALSEFDVSRVFEGFEVSDIPGGHVYRLTASTATVDHDDVEAVKDNDSLRWIKDTGTSPVALPDYEVYADPNGDDDDDGTVTSPKRTMYAAVQAALTHGGGTIYFTNATPAGGPITNQGLWLRADNIAVPGFLQTGFSRLRFVGMGTDSGNFVFQRPGAARITGGFTFDMPSIWVVGGEIPMDFEFMMSSRSGLLGYASPVRIGWDYARRPDFTLEEISVTHAARAARATTFDVDLTTATPWVITSAQRFTDNGLKYVDLTLTRPLTVAMSPWAVGSIVRVDTGGDTDFPDGDYTVTGQSDVLNLQGETTVIVTYRQDGTNMTKSLSGTVTSHGCAVGDRLALWSDASQFPTCSMMKVTAVTAESVTVFDPYGYSPRSATASADDIGTIVKQVRGRSVSSGIWFNNCSIYGNSETEDDFVSSPAIDIGGTSAALIRFDKTYVSGGLVWQWFNAPADCYDPDRTMVAIFADPGAGTASGASFEAYSCQSQSGCVRWYPHETEASLYVSQWLQDSAGEAFPTINCGDGSAFASVKLDRIANADADVAAIDIGSGYDQLKVQIGDVFSSNPVPVTSRSGIIGPTNMRTSYWTSAGTASPWALNWKTIYSGGLSTPHKNIHWATLSARLENQFPALANWQDAESFPAGITVTQDGTAPNGSAAAFKIVSTNLGTTAIKVGLYPFGTWDDGDGVVFGAWTKFPAAGSAFALSDYSGGTMWDGTSILDLTRYLSSFGWQPIVIGARLETSGAFAGKFYISLTVPFGTSYIWLPTLLRSPAGVLTDDEFYEWAANAPMQPLSLPVGANGTPEGVKFIAHGGIGGDSRDDIVLDGSPNGIVVPYYDKDTGALLGYFPLSDEA